MYLELDSSELHVYSALSQQWLLRHRRLRIVAESHSFKVSNAVKVSDSDKVTEPHAFIFSDTVKVCDSEPLFRHSRRASHVRRLNRSQNLKRSQRLGLKVSLRR